MKQTVPLTAVGRDGKRYVVGEAEVDLETGEIKAQIDDEAIINRIKISPPVSITPQYRADLL